MRFYCILLLGILNFACSTQTDQSNSTTEAPTTEPMQQASSEAILGERIDGPANIRDTVNGKILFELYDSVLVETTPIENDWMEVGVFVQLTDQQMREFKILPGTELFTMDSQLIGKAIDTVELWMASDVGLIGGYTYKTNLKPNTIPEVALMNNLKQYGHSIASLKGYLNNFRFEEESHYGDSTISEYFIYQSLLVDISPRDRISLLFESEELIAIVHSRSLPKNNFKTYELIRGHKLTVISDLPIEKIEKLRVEKIKLYNSID